MSEETLNELDDPDEQVRTIARSLGLAMEPATIAELAQTMMRSPNSTIEPSDRRSDAAGKQAVADLEGHEHRIMTGLAMESTIGQGGMGIVRLATQRSLGRKVAVKTLRPESRTDAATLRLLREAWVTGSLEHPNIVPVYDLGLDEDGSPIIVLKKIEGVEWGELINDAKLVEQRFGGTDLLEYNLRILVQLCNAVSLAHARKIVHRDLKPENVMIGSYGEVYLVDWGIAVSLVPDPEGRLPVVKEVADIAGTPCYMAPEMVGAMGTITQRTDIYLLGAILHEILTGRPPHQGNFTQIMASIVTSTFRYDPSIPAELAAIAQKAMARDAANRFASADDLRKAVEQYLERRGSLALSAEAEKRLVSMRELASRGGAREDIYRLAAEARFGFRQAEEASRGNEHAVAGLRATIELLVRFELDHGTPEGAASALAELKEPPAELTAQVQAALAAHDVEKKKIEELARIGAQFDPTTGRRTRLAASILIVGTWILSPLTGPWMEHHFSSDLLPRLLYVWMAVLAGFVQLISFWGRESLSKTSVNRRTHALVLISLAVALTTQLVCRILKVSFDTMIILHFVVWFHGACNMTAFIERRVWGTALSYFIGIFAAAFFPQYKWQVMSLTCVGVAAAILYAWVKLDEDQPAQLRTHIKAQIAKNRAARR